MIPFPSELLEVSVLPCGLFFVYIQIFPSEMLHVLILPMGRGGTELNENTFLFFVLSQFDSRRKCELPYT